MRRIKSILPFLLLLTALISCNKDLNVNAGWKDITVVYGLLDQSENITYIKITKAFLGPGNALSFAKISDSSNYPGNLEVRLDEYVGTVLKPSYTCADTIVHNKQKGDSVFYYPDQHMYRAITKGKLDQNNTYRLHILNKTTGKEITSETEMVHDFEILYPQGGQAAFQAGQSFRVRWAPAVNAKRYQLTVRFFYSDILGHDTTHRSIDWVVTNFKVVGAQSTQDYDEYYSGDGFYSVVGALVDTTIIRTRVADSCQYIFSVAASALNTYMEVTEPSLTIVQEKPAFTNIVNGIGLFSSRYTKVSSSPGVTPATKQQLKTNIHTAGRGFKYP